VAGTVLWWPDTIATLPVTLTIGDDTGTTSVNAVIGTGLATAH
jgi:hypothetical protein